jgi:hypothetical protein
LNSPAAIVVDIPIPPIVTDYGHIVAQIAKGNSNFKQRAFKIDPFDYSGTAFDLAERAKILLMRVALALQQEMNVGILHESAVKG